MTIFRKVFDSKKSTSVPAYFERVATPEDVRADLDEGPTSEAFKPEGPPAPVSHPVTSEPASSHPVTSRPILSRPVSSTPAKSDPASSGPVSVRPAISHSVAAQAGPDHVVGPIFGIGHSDTAEPAHSQPTVQQSGQQPAQSAATSVPDMPGTPTKNDATPSPGYTASAPRTRLLGFHRSHPIAHDPLEGLEQEKIHAEELFAAGWVAITHGPGEGNTLPVYSRVCVIGRGEDQDIRLDFGDTSISRSKHAAIAFDDETCKFYLGHGGKSNLIRLNDRPVLSTEELRHGDTIRIGETTLRFVALCGEDFTWNGSNT